MILLVGFEMLGQVSNSFAQNRNLNFRGSRIGWMDPVIGDDRALCFLRQTHHLYSTGKFSDFLIKLHFRLCACWPRQHEPKLLRLTQREDVPNHFLPQRQPETRLDC